MNLKLIPIAALAFVALPPNQAALIPYARSAVAWQNTKAQSDSSALLARGVGEQVEKALEVADEAPFLFGQSRTAFVSGVLKANKQPVIEESLLTSGRQPSTLDTPLLQLDTHAPPSSSLEASRSSARLHDGTLNVNTAHAPRQDPDAASRLTKQQVFPHLSSSSSAAFPASHGTTENVQGATGRQLPLHVDWGRKSARGSFGVADVADREEHPSSAVGSTLPLHVQWSTHRPRGSQGANVDARPPQSAHPDSSTAPAREVEVQSTVSNRLNALMQAAVQPQEDQAVLKASPFGRKRKVQKGDDKIAQEQAIRAQNLAALLAANPMARGPTGGKLHGSMYPTPQAAREAKLLHQRKRRQWIKEHPGEPYVGQRKRYKSKEERVIALRQKGKMSKRRDVEARRLEAAQTKSQGNQVTGSY